MNSTYKGWLTPIAFANIYIIWGVTFLAITFGLKGFPPFILSGLRFFVAGIILFLWKRAKGEKANSLSNWKKNAITGTLILTGGTGLVGWGEQYVTSTEAAICIASGPFWFIALDRKNWKNYFSDRFIPIGLITGFLGLLIFLNGSVKGGHNYEVDTQTKVIAFIVIAASSIIWVTGSLYSKRNPASQSTFMNISQQLIVAGVAAFIIAGVKGEYNNFSIQKVPAEAWYGLLYLIFFGSLIAYMSYIWLLSFKPSVLVSTHTYINPIVAVFVGFLIAGEIITSVQVAGLIIILTGVLLTNFSQYKKTFALKSRIRNIYRVIIVQIKKQAF